jgi:hypothetical protein
MSKGLAPLTNKTWQDELGDKIASNTAWGYHGLRQTGLEALKKTDYVKVLDALDVPASKFIDQTVENERDQHMRFMKDMAQSDRSRLHPSVLNEKFNPNAFAVTGANVTTAAPVMALKQVPGGEVATGVVKGMGDHWATYDAIREGLEKAGMNKELANELASQAAWGQTKVNAVAGIPTLLNLPKSGQPLAPRDAANKFVADRLIAGGQEAGKHVALNQHKRDIYARLGIKLEGLNQSDQDEAIAAAEKFFNTATIVPLLHSKDEKESNNATNGAQLPKGQVQWRDKEPHALPRSLPSGWREMSGPPIRQDGEMETSTDNLQPYGLYPTGARGLYLLADPHYKEALLIDAQGRVTGATDANRKNPQGGY